jgi:hypothetical protein
MVNNAFSWVHIVRGCPRHPASQGSVERSHAPYKKAILAKLKEQDSEDWVHWMHVVQSEVNNRPSRSRGNIKPYTLYFNQTNSLHCHLYLLKRKLFCLCHLFKLVMKRKRTFCLISKRKRFFKTLTKRNVFHKNQRWRDEHRKKVNQSWRDEHRKKVQIRNPDIQVLLYARRALNGKYCVR